MERKKNFDGIIHSKHSAAYRNSKPLVDQARGNHRSCCYHLLLHSRVFFPISLLQASSWSSVGTSVPTYSEFKLSTWLFLFIVPIQNIFNNPPSKFCWWCWCFNEFACATRAIKVM